MITSGPSGDTELSILTQALETANRLKILRVHMAPRDWAKGWPMATDESLRRLFRPGNRIAAIHELQISPCYHRFRIPVMREFVPDKVSLSVTHTVLFTACLDWSKLNSLNLGN